MHVEEYIGNTVLHRQAMAKQCSICQTCNILLTMKQRQRQVFKCSLFA